MNPGTCGDNHTRQSELVELRIYIERELAKLNERVENLEKTHKTLPVGEMGGADK